MRKHILFIIMSFAVAFADSTTEDVKTRERNKAYQVFHENFPKMYANIEVPDTIVGRIFQHTGRDFIFGTGLRSRDDDVLGRDKRIMREAYERSLDTLNRNSGDVIMASLIYNAISQDSKNTLKDSLAMQSIIATIPFSLQATRVLYENAAYPGLQKYRNEILSAIEKRKLFDDSSERTKDTALVALKIFLSNKQEREIIRKDTTLWGVIQNQDHLLALLGDPIAENRLIERYNNTKSFSEIRRTARNLVFVNSPKTIRALLNNFNEDVFLCGCMESIRVPIINELYRLYPDERLLGRLDQYFIGYSHKLADSSWADWEWHAKRVKEAGLPFEDWTGIWIPDYVKFVLNWIKKKYNIIPPKTNKPLALHKDMCGTLTLIGCSGEVIRKPHNRL